ncbi:MAG: TIGR04282 family arsenosugar biosynthesis glycosyltransferase [Planctomycetaceae bacterium]
MFARHPEPGRTKTRLAAAIGDDVAAELSAAFLHDLLQRCPKLADRFLVAATPCDPATADWFEPKLADNARLVFQPDGDLGQKIAWFFNSEATVGDRAVLIGSDSPDLPTSVFETAFQRLNDVDLVVSPATDGGFVLIGLRRQPGELFREIRWSSEETLSDLLDAATRCGLSTERLSPWYDIDVVSDLVTLHANLLPTDSPTAACPATVRVLQSHWSLIERVLADL